MISLWCLHSRSRAQKSYLFHGLFLHDLTYSMCSAPVCTQMQAVQLDGDACKRDFQIIKRVGVCVGVCFQITPVIRDLHSFPDCSHFQWVLGCEMAAKWSDKIKGEVKIMHKFKHIGCASQSEKLKINNVSHSAQTHRRRYVSHQYFTVIIC